MGACSSHPTLPAPDAPRSSTHPVPKIKKTTIPKALKKAVWDTYFGESIGAAKCPCCKRAKIRQIEFHCGHKLAEAKGGKTTLDNLIPLCAQCNLSMGTRSFDEFSLLFLNK